MYDIPKNKQFTSKDIEVNPNKIFKRRKFIMSLTPEEKERLKNENKVATLKLKGFKKYEYVLGSKKLVESKDLIPYNCKNLSGRMDNGVFVQTNKGTEMATKLALRELRGTIKDNREKIKTLKSGVDILKKTIKK